MIDFQFHTRLELYRVEWGDETQLFDPTYSQLAQCLDMVRSGSSVNHCVECSARLMGDIESQLHFMRVNDIDEGLFLGWIVHLSSNHELDSFLLADATSACDSRLPSSKLVELIGCHECVDNRCIHSHAALLTWIRRELMGSAAARQYRWIDFAMALRAL